MRYFRFFFVLSLGVIIFFFLARVLIGALLIAAALSALFFVIRKLRNAFMPDHEYARPQVRQEPPFAAWRQYDEPLFYEGRSSRDPYVNERWIEVQ